MSLPPPADLTSLVLRTDFSDDAAWEAVQTAVASSSEYPCATFVSDPAYAGVDVQALIDADSRAEEDDKVTYLFIADALTMAEGEHPLLAVDLWEEPGRTFRVTPRWFADVSANLCIANLSFYDFADAADASGTYRGSQGK
jgi:uncharacterized protein DUF6924